MINTLTRFEGVSSPPDLNAGDIHVWRGALDGDGADISCLSPSEIERAARFKFCHDRERFIAGRSLVRNTLAAYHDVRPEKLSFSENNYGKPHVNNGKNELTFTFSRSGEECLLGIQCAGIIGIDIEKIVEKSDLKDVAALSFSDAENFRLAEFPMEKRLAAFYACWTRKEAVVKALGVGLSAGLKDFDVCVDPATVDVEITGRGDLSIVNDWRLISFSPIDNVIGAVATSILAPKLLFLRHA